MIGEFHWTRALDFKEGLLECFYRMEQTGGLTAAVEAAYLRAIDLFMGKIPEGFERMKVDLAYIQGALTGASDEDKRRYEDTSQACFESEIIGYAPHLFGTDPIVHPSVTGTEVHDIDYLFAVPAASFHFSWISPISEGIGIEKGWTEIAGIPTVYFVPKGERFSRLVLGMRNCVKQIEYSSNEEALDKARKLLEEIQEFRLRTGNFAHNFFLPDSMREKSPDEFAKSIRILDLETGNVGAVASYAAPFNCTGDGNITAVFPDGSTKRFFDGHFFRLSAYHMFREWIDSNPQTNVNWRILRPESPALLTPQQIERQETVTRYIRRF